jgi:hypothetical protein
MAIRFLRTNRRHLSVEISGLNGHRAARGLAQGLDVRDDILLGRGPFTLSMNML